MSDFRADIPFEVAMRAHSGTSFTPEKRAESEIAGYAATLDRDREMILSLGEDKESLEAEFNRYREGYKARTLAHLHAKSRIVSTMIAGPSNFPVRRMEKRNETEHKRLEELISFRERALDAIRKKFQGPSEDDPIMSGDENAVDKLRAKIARLEDLQEKMKAANAAIRKHRKAGKEAQAAALVAVGFDEEQSRKLLEAGRFEGDGFASFQLTNNNANIRRLKARLAQVERAKVAPAVEIESENGIRMEDCPAENRVRLYFPGKPDEETRSTLKARAFRWTPSLGCWQAYRNDNSLSVARKLATA